MKAYRKHIRLPNYDYSTPGGYFITICADCFRCIFGEIAGGTMMLSECGNIADHCLKEIPEHYEEVEIDALQVMPNHMHAIILLHKHRHTLGKIIGSYKAVVTRRIRQLPGCLQTTVWETNYYEHVIRNDDSLQRIRQYIVNDPLKWELDRYHPARQKRDEADDWLDFLADGQ